jgi:RNA polymerase sigma-70 factor (ECF subfamily)
MSWSAAEFDAMYRRHAPLVHRRARALLGSDAAALDVVQDLFTSLYERPDQFKGTSALPTFLYSATTHACWTRLRNGRNRLRLIEQEGHASFQSSGAPDPELLAQLRQLLARLEEPLASVLVYYFFDQMTHAEIAELVGCSRRQVGYLLERLDREVRSEGEATP